MTHTTAPAAARLARRAAVAAGLGLLAGALLYLVLTAAGRHLPYWQLWLVITAGLLLAGMVRAAGAPEGGPAAVPQPPPDPPVSPFRAAERWERRLATTQGDPGWYAEVAHARIAGLVAERLRQRHGVRLAADPARAQQLLGEELYAFLTTAPSRTPSPAELRRLTTRMEEI